MKSLKVLSTVSLVTLMSLASIGCAKGPKGDPGVPGENGSLGSGSGKVVKTIYCSWEIQNINGVYSFLNGLIVEYNAAVTGVGDVYASASVAEYAAEYDQTSASKVYAKNSLGSIEGAISLRLDPSDAKDSVWTISYNRVNNDPEVTFLDGSGSMSPTSVNVPVSANDCTISIF